MRRKLVALVLLSVKHWISPALISLIWTGQPVLAQLPKYPLPTVLNLRAYGWEPPERGEVDGPSIRLDHQGRVLVGFTVRKRDGLVTRTQPSLDFRIIRHFTQNLCLGL
jgi:hypothetical protein